MDFLMTNKILIVLFLLLTVFSCTTTTKQSSNKKDFSVIAYYTGNGNAINKYPVDKLTHIIFSFLHLKGNELSFDNSNDSLTLTQLAALKKKHKNLKIIISLGGWGGCETCPVVFSTDKGRNEFARSVKKILLEFNADGIDLDWEYPAIEGYPNHMYSKYDKYNFTSLIKELRKVLGDKFEISFAAGGFTDYIKNSVEWKKVMPLVDRVNVMTYDLVNGYSRVTGHHTPLYSTEHQKESVDNAIRMLDSIGVERNKTVIGAAFYARVWKNVPDINNGLYQSGKFKTAVNYKDFTNTFTKERGFKYYWDNTAQAPYTYSSKEKLFATFDDSASISLKTEYAVKKNLAGIMFWELKTDKYKNGLVDVIYSTMENYGRQ